METCEYASIEDNGKVNVIICDITNTECRNMSNPHNCIYVSYEDTPVEKIKRRKERFV